MSRCAANKEIVDDLWREAQRIHCETPVGGHDQRAIQLTFAADGP